MLEKMGAFFDSRLDGYEEHQLTCIEGAQSFYLFTASCLPMEPHARILDLGCGTGLELDYYFQFNPSAVVTGVDLAPGMLAVLRKKFSDRDITIIEGSYFDVPFPENYYDAAVSVESPHHFTKSEKMSLYCKVYRSLKPHGYFILTDYFAQSNEEELRFRNELDRLKVRQGITNNELYHYDTPLTVEHEMHALQEADFPTVEILNHWGATHTLKASK